MKAGQLWVSEVDDAAGRGGKVVVAAESFIVDVTWLQVILGKFGCRVIKSLKPLLKIISL